LGNPNERNSLTGPCLKAKVQTRLNYGAQNKIRLVNDKFFDSINRPKNSMLNINSFEKDFQHIMEPWQVGVDLAFLEVNK